MEVSDQRWSFRKSFPLRFHSEQSHAEGFILSSRGLGGALSQGSPWEVWGGSVQMFSSSYTTVPLGEFPFCAVKFWDKRRQNEQTDPHKTTKDSMWAQRFLEEIFRFYSWTLAHPNTNSGELWSFFKNLWFPISLILNLLFKPAENYILRFMWVHQLETPCS